MATMTVTSKIDHHYLMNKSKFVLACFTMMIVDMKTDLEVENERLRKENEKLANDMLGLLGECDSSDEVTP